MGKAILTQRREGAKTLSGWDSAHLLQEWSSCADLYSGCLAFSVRNGQFWSVLKFIAAQARRHEFHELIKFTETRPLVHVFVGLSGVAADEDVRAPNKTMFSSCCDYSMGFCELRSMAQLKMTGRDME